MPLIAQGVEVNDALAFVNCSSPVIGLSSSCTSVPSKSYSTTKLNVPFSVTDQEPLASISTGTLQTKSISSLICPEIDIPALFKVILPSAWVPKSPATSNFTVIVSALLFSKAVTTKLALPLPSVTTADLSVEKWVGFAIVNM